MSDWDLAALLAKHGAGWIDNGKETARCYCVHRPMLGDWWHRHVADALIAAGVTVPEPVPPRCTGRIGHRRCILDTGHRGGHF